MIEELIFFLCFFIAATFDRLIMINTKVKLHERIRELEDEIVVIKAEIEKAKYDTNETADMLSLQETLMKEYVNKEGLAINIPTTIYEEGADDCKESDHEKEDEYSDVWRPVIDFVEAEMKVRLAVLKEHNEDVITNTDKDILNATSIDANIEVDKFESLTEIYNRHINLLHAPASTDNK